MFRIGMMAHHPFCPALSKIFHIEAIINTMNAR